MGIIALTGMIAISFGIGSYYVTDTVGPFGWANGLYGAAALGLAALTRLKQIRFIGTPAARRVLFPSLIGIGVAFFVGSSLEVFTSKLGWQFDFTSQKIFKLSSGTIKLLSSLDS